VAQQGETAADDRGARQRGPHMHVLHDAGGSGSDTPLPAPWRDHIATCSSPVTRVPSVHWDDSYVWAYSHGYRPSS
jgi:hypothetical protein